MGARCQNLGAASSNRVRTRQDTRQTEGRQMEDRLMREGGKSARLSSIFLLPNLLIIIGCVGKLGGAARVDERENKLEINK